MKKMTTKRKNPKMMGMGITKLKLKNTKNFPKSSCGQKNILILKENI